MRGVVAAAALVLGGCAGVLPSGARATGEPLRVDVQEEQFSAVVSEPVGQVTMTDASGQKVGTATVSENRLVHMRDVHWRGVQGRLALSDEDLFRIAGDSEAAEIDRSYRRTGRLMRDAGAVLAVATLAELIAARAIGWRGSVADGVAIGCYGGLIGGVMLVVYGHQRLVPDAHPVDRERAEDAVQRYNQTLPAPPRVTDPTGAAASAAPPRVTDPTGAAASAAPDAPKMSFAPAVLEVSGRW
jgi:hypothetical protein